MLNGTMPAPNPNLRLEPATLADRAAIADIIARANWDDPYGQWCVPFRPFASSVRQIGLTHAASGPGLPSNPAAQAPTPAFPCLC